MILNAVATMFRVGLGRLYYVGQVQVDEENRRMTKWLKSYWLLSTISTTVCLSLFFIYWFLVIIGSANLYWSDTVSHTIGAILLLVDLFINARQPRFGHFIYPLVFGMFYVFVINLPFTLLGGTKSDNYKFIYPMLDWKQETTRALLFSLAAIAFVTFIHFFVTF